MTVVPFSKHPTPQAFISDVKARWPNVADDAFHVIEADSLRYQAHTRGRLELYTAETIKFYGTRGINLEGCGRRADAHGNYLVELPGWPDWLVVTDHAFAFRGIMPASSYQAVAGNAVAAGMG
jgi:hypothetical protein